MIKDSVTSLIRTLQRERVFALILALLVILLVGAIGFSLVEPAEGPVVDTGSGAPCGGVWSP